MEPVKRTFPRWIWLVYLLIFSLSVPWYWTEDAGMQLLLGLPLWVCSSIGAILLCACFSFWIINKYWQE